MKAKTKKMKEKKLKLKHLSRVKRMKSISSFLDEWIGTKTLLPKNTVQWMILKLLLIKLLGLRLNWHEMEESNCRNVEGSCGRVFYLVFI